MKHVDDVPHGIDSYEYNATFWRRSQYGSYEEATKVSGTYKGETCFGYTSFVDAMANVAAAANCMDSNYKNDLIVRVVLDEKDLGDFTF